jgi:hypothetical protein
VQENNNAEVKQNDTMQFGEHYADNENIIDVSDMYISDFKFIADNVHLHHDQFKTNNVWDKKICPPILDTKLKLRFRTIINNAAAMEPNFDGKYKIIIFGAGSGITAYFVLDLNTGIVYEPHSPSYFGMDYNVNSSLLIINPPTEVIQYWEPGYNTIPGWVQTEYLIIMNEKLRTLLLINPVIDN